MQLRVGLRGAGGDISQRGAAAASHAKQRLPSRLPHSRSNMISTTTSRVQPLLDDEEEEAEALAKAEGLQLIPSDAR